MNKHNKFEINNIHNFPLIVLNSLRFESWSECNIRPQKLLGPIIFQWNFISKDPRINRKIPFLLILIFSYIFIIYYVW